MTIFRLYGSCTKQMSNLGLRIKLLKLSVWKVMQPLFSRLYI
jgi:hypothetical protein